MSTYIKSIANTLYKKLLNTVDGVEFNRKAHEQARNSAYKYHEHDAEILDEEDADWETVNLRSRLRAESSEGEYMIDEPRGVVSQMMYAFPLINPFRDERDWLIRRYL